MIWDDWLADRAMVQYGIPARAFDLEKNYWDCHKGRKGKYFYLTATEVYSRQHRQSNRARAHSPQDDLAAQVKEVFLQKGHNPRRQNKANVHLWLTSDAQHQASA